MKKLLFTLLTLSMLLTVPLTALAGDTLAELDKLNDEKTISNYQKSIQIAEDALKANPNDFELNWRCSRANRWYGELAKRADMQDWKDICAKYGKAAMGYAQKAIDANPNKPHGYYWYGLAVGIYSDGVSILTALSEGLKDKTQNSFEKVYELNKNFEKAGAILSLGRFWSVLPWPLKDNEKSLKYLHEYQKTQYFGKKIPEGPIFLSEVLIDMGGDENKAEAKQLLTNLKTDNKYFKDWADRLLAKLS